MVRQDQQFEGITTIYTSLHRRGFLSDHVVKDQFLKYSFVPQGFVLAVTVVREAVDEVRRHQRDKEMNSQLYSKLTVRG